MEKIVPFQKENCMYKEKFDFYSPIDLKVYNLENTVRYELNLLEKLDPFTRRHSENVANLTCRVCEHLRLNQEFIAYATINAYLHDIGKLFIPPEILNKPTKLTEEEYEVMKTHTTLGYKLCMGDLKLRPYAVGTLNHHEALNGTGYPNGLVKKDIPFVAQIIRVADEYDAIVTKRQYKTHIHISETLKELIKDAQPTKELVALDHLAEGTKVGKINARVLKALFKVVIDDTKYEISCIYDYIDYLKKEIKRLQTIQTYAKKSKEAKSEYKKSYYLECMRVSFMQGENFNNYEKILDEYETALKTRNQIIDQLFNEIKIIKKLKV